MIRRASMDDLESINKWNARYFGEVDFSEFLANRMNVCLIQGEGGAFFAWRGPGIYEAHAFFEQRGRDVLDVSHAMLDLMRRDHGAVLFWSLVPLETEHARIYCRLIGWRSYGIVNPPQGECEIFASENVQCLQS
jgi:hypothetical protein